MEIFRKNVWPSKVEKHPRKIPFTQKHIVITCAPFPLRGLDSWTIAGTHDPRAHDLNMTFSHRYLSGCGCMGDLWVTFTTADIVI